MNIEKLRAILYVEYANRFTDVLEYLTYDIKTDRVPFEPVSGFMPFTDGGIESSGYISITNNLYALNGFNDKTDLMIQKAEDHYYQNLDDDDADEPLRIELGCFIYGEDNNRKAFEKGSFYLFFSLNDENPYFREKYSTPLMELEFEMKDTFEEIKTIIDGFLDEIVNKISRRK